MKKQNKNNFFHSKTVKASHNNNNNNNRNNNELFNLFYFASGFNEIIKSWKSAQPSWPPFNALNKTNLSYKFEALLVRT